jgi:thiaminase
MASVVEKSDIAARITAIRDKWHFKQHPLSQALARGELDLRVLAVYMAQHAKYVRYGLQAFGHLYARGASDVRKMREHGRGRRADWRTHRSWRA